jgi:hypothetical protein
MRRAECRIANAIVLTAAIVAAAGAADAHETRLVGPNDEYQLVVGFRVEPGFEDVVNGPDLIVTRASDHRPVDTDAGDIFNVQVEIQIRDHEAFSSSVVQAATLNPPVGKAFGTLNRYQGSFKPTVDGTYAFHITGTISDASSPAAGPVTIDETFVCGAGTQAANGHGFNCIRDPQIFPVGHKDKNGKDKSGYEDDDGLNGFR